MNEIIYLNEKPEINSGKTIIIDGEKILTKLDFLKLIYNSLDFPEKNYMNWDAYLDWMRDLSWIEEKEINIVVINYKSLFKDDFIYSLYFVPDFENIIFPFWEKSAKEIFVDDKYIKTIKLYCVN